MKLKNWLFEVSQYCHIAKPLAIVVRKKGEKTVITKIRNESGDVTTDLTEIKKKKGL